MESAKLMATHSCVVNGTLQTIQEVQDDLLAPLLFQSTGKTRKRWGEGDRWGEAFGTTGVCSLLVLYLFRSS